MNALVPPARKRGNYDWDTRDRGDTSAKVTAHFGDVASALEHFLTESESVVGCVAWLSSPRMVAALAGKPVAFIVNKEFSLRSTDNKAASKRKRAIVAQLTGGLHTKNFPAPLPAMDAPLDPIRCVGVAGKAYAPFMHSKFVVRLSKGKPVAVWTGSFNLTAGAEMNIENGIEIHDPVIARAYLEEFARVAAVSEPAEFRTGGPAPQSTARPGAPEGLATRTVRAGTRVPAKRKAATKRTATGKPSARASAAGKPAAKKKPAKRRA